MTRFSESTKSSTKALLRDRQVPLIIAPNSRTITTELPPDLPAVVGVRDYLIQVVLNLVLNAIDATDDLGRIHLAAQAEEGWLHLTVEDNGRGISIARPLPSSSSPSSRPRPTAPAWGSLQSAGRSSKTMPWDALRPLREPGKGRRFLPRPSARARSRWGKSTNDVTGGARLGSAPPSDAGGWMRRRPGPISPPPVAGLAAPAVLGDDGSHQTRPRLAMGNNGAKADEPAASTAKAGS